MLPAFLRFPLIKPRNLMINLIVEQNIAALKLVYLSDTLAKYYLKWMLMFQEKAIKQLLTYLISIIILHLFIII